MYFRIKKERVKYNIFDEGDLYIIDFETGIFYTTNKTGGDVWKWIENGAGDDDIIRGLRAKYTGSTIEDIKNEVDRFINSLKEANLIEVDEIKKADDPNGSRIVEQIVSEAKAEVFEAPILNHFTDMKNLMMIDPIDDVDDLGWPFNDVDDLGWPRVEPGSK